MTTADHILQLARDRAVARRMRPELRPTWREIARAEQVAPDGDWATWLYMAGRGSGKTRAGAEWVHEQIAAGCRRIALVGGTASDVRDVMIEGESGILATARTGVRPDYEPSRRRLTWPSGAIATAYSAEEPERLRGPQHDGAWADELGAWKYEAAWDMLMLGLRLGTNPRSLVTTTPRPTKLVRSLLSNSNTAVTRGSTYDNRDNLAPSFFSSTITRYEGTRLGRQELMGELIEDVDGALWSRAILDASRVGRSRVCSFDDHSEMTVEEKAEHYLLSVHLTRIVTAVDPAGSAREGSDETGIVVAGIGDCDCNGKRERHGFVLADSSGKYSPQGWASAACRAHFANNGDRIVAEMNFGGDLVKTNIQQYDPNIPFTPVHASRGKAVRAEPISALWEQGKMHLVGSFAALEDQMCNFVVGLSGGPATDDRVDAMVWAFSNLMITGGAARITWV